VYTVPTIWYISAVHRHFPVLENCSVDWVFKEEFNSCYVASFVNHFRQGRGIIYFLINCQLHDLERQLRASRAGGLIMLNIVPD
jgi:hypothetical protein